VRENPTDGSIGLPRFTLAYEVRLDEALGALGMGAAFDPRQADFKRLGGASTWVDKVKHKARLEVNEEGTEAAAATVIVAVIGDIDDFTPMSFAMFVDRPFFFVIRDEQTGALLFMGSVVDPTS
jgi:serpin B